MMAVIFWSLLVQRVHSVRYD